MNIVWVPVIRTCAPHSLESELSGPIYQTDRRVILVRGAFDATCWDLEQISAKSLLYDAICPVKIARH